MKREKRKPTVMARVYPADVRRLDAIRKWLQAEDGGNDKTIADTIAFLAGTFCQLHPTLEPPRTDAGKEA